jgi:hypothetical protein
MIHRSRLYDDAGSNRRKQCRPQEEPENFKRRGQPPQNLPLI